MINELSKQIHQNAYRKGFFDDEKNIGEMLCLIHSEVSECLEADRKHHYANNVQLPVILEISDTRDTEARISSILRFNKSFEDNVKNSFEDELSDVMIRCMDLAAFKGIDLEYHIKMKMLYNSHRAHKHGKKY